MNQPSLLDISNALAFVDPNVPRDEWVRVLMGIKSEFGDDAFDIADNWSRAGSSYKADSFKSTWKSISVSGSTTVATVFKIAVDNGYKPEVTELSDAAKAKFKLESEKRAKARAKQEAIELAQRKQWHGVIADFSSNLLSNFTIPIKSNKYLSTKKVNSFGLNSFKCNLILVINDDFLTNVITGGKEIKQFFDCLPDERSFSFLHIKRGDLAIPLIDVDKKIWNIQIINGNGKKMFLKHGRKSGCFNFIGDADNSDVIAEAEGYATAASVHMATGWFCIYAFDAGNLPVVAKLFRPLYPNKPFVVCADNDVGTKGNPGVAKAKEAALAVDGVVAIPDFSAVEAKAA